MLKMKDTGNEQLDDPWALVDPPSRGKPWKEKNCKERFVSVIRVLLVVGLLLGFLYLFICSLDFLSSAFRLLGGKTAGEAFRANDILTNPIADLMMGVLATVLLQSSSTTTSIVVAMVGSGIMPIRPAIFIIMGANIGTSVTNTIVSMGQVVDRNEFRRAFAGATVHDMFNCLAVLILLPIEWLSGAFGKWKDCGLLCQLTAAIVRPLRGDGDRESLEKQELLKVLTKPFTELIVRIDKKIVTKIAIWNETAEGGPFIYDTLMKKCHDTVLSKPYLLAGQDNCTFAYNDTTHQLTLQQNEAGSCVVGMNETEIDVNCGYLFEGVVGKWGDAEIGVAVLVFALATLIVCLVCIVKILHYLLQGKIALLIKKLINADLPGGRVGKEITGYITIAVGAGLTMLVQSSSIFTSAMTPLVGVGVLHIDRMYPLTLGANIGTTITAVLASLAISGEGFVDSFQIAMCHLFFNIIGIMIWYPLPIMRSVPIALAKVLGNITAKHRWFAILYLLLVFFILPAGMFGLSLAGWEIMLGVAGPIFVFFMVIVLINVCQNKCPDRMPCGFRDWSCCPKPLHSFAPYDNLCTVCCPNKKDNDEKVVVGEEDSQEFTVISEKQTEDINGSATNNGYLVD